MRFYYISGRMQLDELWRQYMDTLIQELKRRGKLGLDLTSVDWSLLLQEASDNGSLRGVFAASAKLKMTPPLAVLENLLLTAICTGNCEEALNTSKELKRKLSVVELGLLTESTILCGNVQGLLNTFYIYNPLWLAILHTTMAIAASRLLRKNKGLTQPKRSNLHSWVQIYNEDFALFSPEVKYSILSDLPPPGTFFIFSQETCLKLIGVLLVENMITKQAAAEIISFHS